MNRTYDVRTLIFSVAILDRRRRRPLTDSLPPAPRGGDARRAGPPRPPPRPSLLPLPSSQSSHSSKSLAPIAARSSAAISHTLPAVQLPPSRTRVRAYHGANPGNGNAHNHLAPRLMNAGMRWPGRSSATNASQKWLQFREREVIRARGPSPLEVGEDGDELGVGEVGLAEVAALLPGEREVGVHARCALVHARAVAGAALVAKLRHLGRVRDVLQLDVGVADGKAQPLGERRENPAPVHA